MTSPLTITHLIDKGDQTLPPSSVSANVAGTRHIYTVPTNAYLSPINKKRENKVKKKKRGKNKKTEAITCSMNPPRNSWARARVGGGGRVGHTTKTTKKMKKRKQLPRRKKEGKGGTASRPLEVGVSMDGAEHGHGLRCGGGCGGCGWCGWACVRTFSRSKTPTTRQKIPPLNAPKNHQGYGMMMMTSPLWDPVKKKKVVGSSSARFKKKRKNDRQSYPTTRPPLPSTPLNPINSPSTHQPSRIITSSQANPFPSPSSPPCRRHHGSTTSPP